MSEEVQNTKPLLEQIAIWAGIFSLLFAAITYWLDVNKRRIRKNRNKKQLILELKEIFDNIEINHTRIENTKSNQWKGSISFNIVSFNLLKRIIESGEIYEYDINHDDILQLINALEQLKKIELFLDSNISDFSFRVNSMGSILEMIEGIKKNISTTKFYKEGLEKYT